MDEIIINSEKDFEGLKTGERIKYMCKNCGIYVTRRFRPDALKHYKRFLCKTCEIKETNTLLYGDPNYTNRSKSVQTFNSRSQEEKKASIIKSKNTRKERYGDQNYNNKEKGKQTSLDNWGVDNYAKTNKFKEFMSEQNDIHPEWHEKSLKSQKEINDGLYYVQTEDFKTKSKAKKKEKYGDENYTNREQAKKTYKESTGYETPFENPKVLGECINSVIDKYGSKTYCQSEDYKLNKDTIVEKMKKTTFDHWGVDSFSKTEEFKDLMVYMWDNFPDLFLHLVSPNKLKYEDQYFDSIPEFCVYIYCIHHWIPISRNYTGLDYSDIRGKSHKVYPDFLINGELVEIKGAHFFNENGELYLPYRYESWSDEEYEYQSSIYTSKGRCMIDNGVKILKDTNPWVKMCISWTMNILNISNFLKDRFEDISNGYTPLNCDPTKEYQDPIGIGKTPFDIQ